MFNIKCNQSDWTAKSSPVDSPDRLPTSTTLSVLLLPGCLPSVTQTPPPKIPIPQGPAQGGPTQTGMGPSCPLNLAETLVGTRVIQVASSWLKAF